jgi:uncharacterized protein (DUF1499 family)
MLKAIRWVALAGLLAAAAGFLTYALTTREESVLAVIYETLFGPPDLGPVDFERLVRRRRPNDALACPEGLCPGAEPDLLPPVYAASEEALRAAVTAHALAQPGTVPVYRDDRPGLPVQDRYVVRSARMQFPDTVDIRFIPLTETTSTLAIYSRSQLGIRDFGVNIARVRRLVDPAALGLQVAR